MLEWVAEQYGWMVKFSPKCHPEIAGLGIEYDWATSKGELNRTPLSDRKGYDKFRDVALSHCFSKKVLTPHIIRSNARQARGYMIGYLLAHAVEAAAQREATLGASSTNECSGEEEDSMPRGTVSMDDLRNTITPIAFDRIEKARKSYKRHRGIALFMGTSADNFELTYCMPKKL